MRIAAITCLVGLCFVGAALAQNDLVPEQGFPADYETRPTGSDYARLYPRAAMINDVSGLAVLCCRPEPDRRLRCQYAVDWPRNAGFGEASEEIGRRFRLTPESYEAFNANRYNWIRQTIIWRMGDARNPPLEEARRIVSEESNRLCRPAPVNATEAAPAPEVAPAPEASPQQ